MVRAKDGRRGKAQETQPSEMGRRKLGLIRRIRARGPGRGGRRALPTIGWSRISPAMSERGHLRKCDACRPKDRFLTPKRTLGEVPVNDRFWPNAAVALKPSRMSELGQ